MGTLTAPPAYDVNGSPPPMPTRRWALWCAVGAALEVDAILSGRSTLSRALRSWLGICPCRRYGRLGAAAFMAGCAWLAVHIAFDLASPDLTSLGRAAGRRLPGEGASPDT